MKKYLTLNNLSYLVDKIKTYLTSSTYLNSIGISNSDIDDIADDAGYSSGSLPASEDIYITGDIIPNTDNSVDLGASSKNIKMVYTKGITINGTQFLPSDYVNLTTAQTISGAKTFYASTASYPIIKLKTAFIEQGLYDSDSLRGMAFRCTDKNDAILGDFGYKTERTGEVGSYFSARTRVNNTQTTREVKLRFKPGSTDCELVPDTTNLIDFGSSSYQWNNAYIKSLTINGVACGDILTHNVSEFVNVTSNQIIGGEKTFSNLRTYFGRDISCYSNRKYGKNLNPTSNTYQYLNFSGNTVSEGTTNDWSSGYLEQVVDTNGGSRGRWFVQDTSENGTALEVWASGNDKQVRPLRSNDTDLGTSTRKWKTLNGINPGALSLPSTSFISLDTTNFDVTSTTIGTFTPTVDGWAILTISQKNKHFGIWILDRGYRATFHSVYHDTNYMIFALVPVRANITMTVYCTADDIDSTRKIDDLRVFPCQGNV